MYFIAIISLALLSVVKSQTVGTIEVTVATASLSANANAYADVCIQNDATTAIALPFRDRTACSCQTKTVNASSIPVWQTVCQAATNIRYVSGARVVVEVWNQSTTTTTTFLGGVSVAITQLLSNGDNGKQLTLALANGTASGNLIVKITWTQVTVTPTINFGYLDANLVSAELAKAANAYADICLQNGSDTTAASIPVKDRATCGCQTTAVTNSLHPIWQQACTSARTNRWTNGTRITFEIWDQITTTSNNFLGGAAVNISQMLTAGDNNKEIQLALTGGAGSGKIWVKVTWTPI